MKTNDAAACPNCASKLDAATSARLDDAHPKEGDFSLCAYCGSILVFRADLTLRNATTREAFMFVRDVLPTLRRR